MTISSLPQLLAGFQPPQYFAKSLAATTVAGRPWSTFYSSGVIPAGVANTTLAGATYTNISNPGAGQIPRTDAAGGLTTYVARFVVSTVHPQVVWLCDRLWDNGGITITSTAAQTINSPTWPARDANGQSNGAFVQLAVEVGATTGAATPTITMSYTNSAGTSGQTATNQDPTGSGSVVGDFYRMHLAAGDTGVQSVQSITLGSSWVSGTIHVVAYRIVAALQFNNNNAGIAIDPVTLGLPVIYNGAFLWIVLSPATAATNSIAGCYVEAQG